MKRSICTNCLRPFTACICHCVRKVKQDLDRLDQEIEIVILQHPSEERHAKNSARLLHLCLENSTLIVGDEFEDESLNKILFGGGKNSILLYPEEANATTFSQEHSSLKNAIEMDVADVTKIRIIIIDATWRKSRQMLLSHPLLQKLPRFALKEMPSSHYRIRRAHKEDQLSSLEAGAYVLMQLSKNEEKYLPLLHAFDLFVEMQIRFGSLNLLR
jgi:DTW domain-containing protein YfiP